jgi:hypothetical protein
VRADRAGQMGSREISGRRGAARRALGGANRGRDGVAEGIGVSLWDGDGCSGGGSNGKDGVSGVSGVAIFLPSRVLIVREG